MQNILKESGIEAKAMFIWKGSMKGTWRLYKKNVSWWNNTGLHYKLAFLGFSDYDGDVLDKFSGNGGHFQIFVRANKEITEKCFN